MEEYQKYKYDQDHLAMMENKDNRVPGKAKINQIVWEYHKYKNHCVTSFKLCAGCYNQKVETTHYAGCLGSYNYFDIYNKHVKEKDANKHVQKLIEHYDFPLYTPINGLRKGINAFYQAKYGLFTCLDSQRRMGDIPFDEDIIT